MKYVGLGFRVQGLGDKVALDGWAVRFVGLAKCVPGVEAGIRVQRSRDYCLGVEGFTVL